MAGKKKRTAEDALAFVRSLDDREQQRFQEKYNREENEPYHRECAGRGLLHLVAKQRQKKLSRRQTEVLRKTVALRRRVPRPTIRAMAKTLRLTEDGIKRRLSRARQYGIL